MDNIIKNPGFQHIVEKSLMCLDRKSIAIFRSVNRDCKRITDSPTFYLEKISQEKPPQAMATLPKRLKLRFFGKSFPQFVEKNWIENWKQLIKKIPNEEIKQILTSEFFQMYAQRCPKCPLELAQELAMNKKKSEFLMFCSLLNFQVQQFL